MQQVAGTMGHGSVEAYFSNQNRTEQLEGSTRDRIHRWSRCQVFVDHLLATGILEQLFSNGD